jgi:hypothetical protein
MRLIRLIRIVKLYKSANIALEQIDDVDDDLMMDDELPMPILPPKPAVLVKSASDIEKNSKTDNKVAPMPDAVEVKPEVVVEVPKPVVVVEKKKEAIVGEESKVGKKLSDLITRRVIVLVLAMLLSVPVF